MDTLTLLVRMFLAIGGIALCIGAMACSIASPNGLHAIMFIGGLISILTSYLKNN